MKLSVVLAFLAGGAISQSCLAQAVVSGEVEQIGPRLRLAQDGTVLARYDERAPGPALDNYLFDAPSGAPSAWSSLGAFNHRHLMRYTWAPGPFATPGTHSVVGINWLFRRNTAFAEVAGSVLQMKFWAAADVSLAGFSGVGTSMINPAATPVATINLGVPTGLTQNVGYGLQYNLGTPVDLPDGEYWVESIILDAGGAQFPTTNDPYRLSCATTSGSLTNPCVNAGTMFNDMGYDRNNDGTFTGVATGGATVERTAYGFNQAVGFTPIASGFSLVGDITGTAPVCGTEAENFVLGADNVVASDSEAIGTDGVKIYCVTLAQGAIDENLGYFNVDTEGSVGDFAIAIYNDQGSLLAADDDSGSGLTGRAAQLSFGIGRAAGEGLNGQQYDGRHWDDSGALAVHGLGAGQYYLYVVASSGASPTFGPGFAVSGVGAGGTANVRIKTNATNLTAPAPSVAPIATRLLGSIGEDPITAPGAPGVATVLDGPGVNWFDVQLCQASDAAGNSVVFNTIHDPNSPAFGMYIFDQIGNLVGQANGNQNSDATVTFTDAPVLNAGTYYIGVTYNGGGGQGDLAPDPANNGRWHLRGRNASGGFTYTTQVFVNWPACGGGIPCELADTNCDGSLNGFDVETTEQAVNGDFSNFCLQSADLNNDGAENGFDVEFSEFLTLNC